MCMGGCEMRNVCTLGQFRWRKGDDWIYISPKIAKLVWVHVGRFLSPRTPIPQTLQKVVQLLGSQGPSVGGFSSPSPWGAPSTPTQLKLTPSSTDRANVPGKAEAPHGRKVDSSLDTWHILWQTNAVVSGQRKLMSLRARLLTGLCMTSRSLKDWWVQCKFPAARGTIDPNQECSQQHTSLSPRPGLRDSDLQGRPLLTPWGRDQLHASLLGLLAAIFPLHHPTRPSLRAWVYVQISLFKDTSWMKAHLNEHVITSLTASAKTLFLNRAPFWCTRSQHSSSIWLGCNPTNIRRVAKTQWLNPDEGK